MDFVDPDDVVISVLAASPFAHPHNSAMDALNRTGFVGGLIP
jgi:beta-lactamase superfamily II metal-dependent hydrolase